MKKNKIDFLLITKIVSVSICYFYSMYFLSFLLHFLYFGSGAGASSNFAISISYILFFLCVLPSMIFILHKIYSFRKTNQQIKFNSYLVSGVLITLFMIYQLITNH